MARRKTKKLIRIIITIVIAAAIVTSAAVYFYPRLAIYLDVLKQKRDCGYPKRAELSGGYGGDYEKITSDWISFNIPLIFGKTEDFVMDKNSNWTKFEGNGFVVLLSYTKEEESNEPIVSKDYDKYLGAKTLNEYKVLLFNTKFQKPSIFLPVERLDEEYSRYIKHICFHKNRKYDYYEKDGMAFTISIAEDKKEMRYIITLYDIEDDFSQIGVMEVVAPISANKEIKLTDGAMLFLLESSSVYEPPKTR